MRVVLTFDTEVWCNGWKNLDKEFSGSFERYVFGRSRKGEFALPKTLEILARNKLRAVFFVEPLFAMRFGTAYLTRIVDLILAAGQEVQLHLHPEWTDESPVPLVEDCRRKRQHLTYYTLDEQVSLISHGVRMLQAAGVKHVSAFRSGSFAANADTLEALARCGLTTDSSLNCCHDVSFPDLAFRWGQIAPFKEGLVQEFPVTVFRDGRGRLRPAQVGACSVAELRDALNQAEAAGLPSFVIVSHNFEMLKPGLSVPDPVVVRRFEKLCGFLGKNRDRFETGGFPDSVPPVAVASSLPKVGYLPTLVRYVEQGLRRLV